MRTPDFIIDCAVNFVPNVDITGQAATTGDYTPVDVTGVTFRLCAARGSATPIHANLERPAQVRSGKVGRLYASFAVADLQSHVLPLAGDDPIWLNLFKDAVFVGQAFRCYIQTDRLRPNP